MYRTLSNLKYCEEAAKKYVIANDRELYKSFLIAIEEWCDGKADIVFGMPMPDQNAYQLEIYTSNPAKVGRQLADHLLTISGGIVSTTTLVLETFIADRELSISVQCRLLAKIYAFGEYRGKSIWGALATQYRKSPFTGKDIRTIPTELTIITSYRTLYSPSAHADWRGTMDVLDTVVTQAQTNIHTVIGGADKTFVDIRKAEAIIRKAITGRTVVIGEQAIGLMNDEPVKGRLQVITDDYEALRTVIQGAVKNQKREISFSEFEVEFVHFALNLPTDFRTRKFTVYIKSSRGTFPILDIFTSGEFELIPFVQREKNKVGTTAVILRFIYIDIWTMQTMNAINGTNVSGRVKYLLGLTSRIEAKIVFQLSDYYGIHTSEAIARKKLMRMKRGPPKYYPVLAKGATAP